MIGRRRDGERPYGPPSASGGPTSPSADSPRLPRLSCGEAGDDLKGHLRAMRGVPSSLAPLRVWRLRLVHAPCDERCGGEDKRRVEEEGVAPGRRLGLGDGCRFRRHPHFVLVSTPPAPPPPLQQTYRHASRMGRKDLEFLERSGMGSEGILVKS